MSVSLNESKTELISNILVAGSQEEVKNLIDRLLKKLEEKEDAEKLSRFIDTAITHLETLNPMEKDAGQWSNITMARIHFQHIQRDVELAVCKV